MSNVVLLRSTPPLFKAYEEVYGILESKFLDTYDVTMFILLIFCMFIILMRLYKETFYWSFACFNMYIEK